MKNQQKNNQPVTEARVGADKSEKSQPQGSNFKNDPARAAEAGAKGGRAAHGGR